MNDSTNKAGRVPRLRNLKNKELSRSKLRDFCECPQCFWLNIRRGVSKVSSPGYTLAIATDALLKKEFDALRVIQQPHPIFARYGRRLIPLAHPQLDAWRHNFTGVRWLDEATGWTLYGAIDDLWVDPATGVVHVADYKSTSKAAEITTESLHPAYGQQMDVYQFLMRRQGFTVSDEAIFYYVNGDKTLPDFQGTLHFVETLVSYCGNDEWVLPAFRAAVAVAESDLPPDASPDCKWCAYREAAAEELAACP